jgi:hypothetical protein
VANFTMILTTDVNLMHSLYIYNYIGMTRVARLGKTISVRPAL